MHMKINTQIISILVSYIYIIITLISGKQNQKISIILDFYVYESINNFYMKQNY